MSTNVPAIQWVNGAPVLPQEADILSGRFADLNAAFGGGLANTPSSPQGQIAATDTAIIGDKNNQIAYIANQVNPTYASGQWQDAIGYIYGLQRIQASGTVVQGTINGAVGTSIPAGAVAQDSSGYLYACTSSVTIPASGTTVAQFQNQTLGAIPCNTGALSKIYTAIPGWDTITNLTPGALGTDLETRAAFEQRRLQSVAINAVNSQNSILAAILSLTNVLDCFVYNNNTASPVTLGSVTVAAHSVMVSVAGGAGQDIANAIWNNLPAGCGMSGNTTFVINDTNYNIPYPQYTIKWQTPATKNVYFYVKLKNLATIPSNYMQLVQSAIIQSFNGQDGGSKARINSTIFADRFIANIRAQNSNLEVLYLGVSDVATSPSVMGNNQLSISIDQLPVTSTSNIYIETAAS